ncbi:hypothetical protein [Bauldia sp.]|uniref:hypothetical protein n=1 Tax=Bauldia sp. TaxID=2575872 RepID=UPI003BAD82FE
MRKFSTWIVAIGLVCATSSATAQTDDPPDLRGLWECEDAVILFREGEWSEVERSVEVIEQRGALFRALNNWSLNPNIDVLGHTFGESTVGGTSPWVGVIDFDNRTILGGAFGDGHQFRGRLIDRDTMQLTMTEAGDHPWSSRTNCRRVGGG